MTPLIPERFLRFSILQLREKIGQNQKTIDTSEAEFWLSRLTEYYAIKHGDLEENMRSDP